MFYVTDGPAHGDEGWSREQIWNCLTWFHRSPGQAACNRPWALHPSPADFTLVTLDLWTSNKCIFPKTQSASSSVKWDGSAASFTTMLF